MNLDIVSQVDAVTNGESKSSTETTPVAEKTMTAAELAFKKRQEDRVRNEKNP